VTDSEPHLVREYLQRELSDYTISEKCVTDPGTLAFVISSPSHSTLLMIRTSVVEDENSRQLVDMLSRMDIAFQFRQHPDIDAFVVSCSPNRL
jgi:hypothetical protein